MSEVEAHSLVVYVRSRLLNVLAENATKRRLKQVAGGMVSHNSIAAGVVNNGVNRVSNLDRAVCNGTNVDINSVCLLGISNVEYRALLHNSSGVANLTATFTVEGGLVKNNGNVTLRDLVDRHIVGEQGYDLCISAGRGITDELGCREIGDEVLRGV